jgi:hypothetical protein
MSRNSQPSKPVSSAPWTISTARQYLPALVASAAKEPQAIYRRNRLVAAVLSPEALDELNAARKNSVGSAFARLRAICREENYQLGSAPRRDRPNPFAIPAK